jgi:hypothetical protein
MAKAIEEPIATFSAWDEQTLVRRLQTILSKLAFRFEGLKIEWGKFERQKRWNALVTEYLVRLFEPHDGQPVLADKNEAARLIGYKDGRCITQAINNGGMAANKLVDVMDAFEQLCPFPGRKERNIWPNISIMRKIREFDPEPLSSETVKLNRSSYDWLDVAIEVRWWECRCNPKNKTDLIEYVHREMVQKVYDRRNAGYLYGFEGSEGNAHSILVSSATAVDLFLFNWLPSYMAWLDESGADDETV